MSWEKKDGKNVKSCSRIKTADAGAIPKLTTSASESNSTPILEEVPNDRAAKPSQKSKAAANITQMTAAEKFPLNAMTMAMQPENRFSSVIILGICFFMLVWSLW
ncbi:hypothetical protein SDC9_107911 [bioreactor metagenome]|uniref:Uncharacterized protein n=1 Tax=bioreactor metagenome TaxID=1076179 RepID=A0A645B6L7_9ZZZZ